jgi:hypothetical protein
MPTTNAPNTVIVNGETYRGQAWQDQFADLVLMSDNGILQKDGFFVDVGAGTEPEVDWGGSNSLVFERRGWKGIAIDSDPNRLRGRSCICESCMIGNGFDGTTTLAEVLVKNNAPKVIDYLSVDVEGYDLIATASLIEAGYTFKVLTIEHNLYCQGPKFKNEIFNYLSTKGYIRIVDNIGDLADIEDLHRRYVFEDWYIDPRLVDYRTTVSRMNKRKEVWGNRNAHST